MDGYTRRLLDFIYEAENSGVINYDQWHNKTQLKPNKPLTEMTVLEVLEWQQANRNLPKGQQYTAAGAGQIIYKTLNEIVNKGVINANDKFTPQIQDKANQYLLNRRGYEKFQAGAISKEEFGNNLAKEWASLPVLQDTYRGSRHIATGQSYHKGVGSNNALVTAGKFDAFLNQAKIFTLMTKDRPVGAATHPNLAPSRPNAGFWLEEQFDRFLPVRDREPPPWEKADIPIDDFGKDGKKARPRLDEYYTRTRRDEAQGAFIHQGSSVAFADEWSDAFIVRGVKDLIATKRYQMDANFHPYQVAINEGFGNQQIEYLSRARNQEHYDYLKNQIKLEGERNRRRAISDHHFSAFMGTMLNPDTLVSFAVPVGFGASALKGTTANFFKTAAMSGAAVGGSEALLEAGRASYDPQYNPYDSITRVGGATIFGGIFGGAFGAYFGKTARQNLINELGLEIAAQKGIGKHFTTDIDIGGRTAKIRMVKTENMEPDMQMSLGMAGGVLHRKGKTTGKKMGPVQEAENPEILVSPEILMKRWEAGDVPSGIKTPNEFLEFEIAKRAALVKNGGQVIINKAEKASVRQTGNIPKWVRRKGETEEQFKKRRNEGKDADGRMGVSPDEITEPKLDPNPEVLIGNIGSIPFKGDVQAGWKKKPRGLSDEQMRQLTAKVDEAEQEAFKKLTKYRKENNKILADSRMEAAGRIMDSPFKYVHRNAKASETRDLVNLLVDDGGLNQRAYMTGMTDQSIDRMKKSWDGEVFTLLQKERELYESYLGYSNNPTVGGIAINKSFRTRRADGERALTVDEFRDGASKALITGVKSDIAQVNEMAEHIRAFYAKFREPAEAYGVLGRGRVIMEGRANLRQQIDEVRKRKSEDPLDADELAKLEKDLADLDEQIKLSKDDPTEDYFTRVWMPQAIEQNRAAFKERVVKPWMKQQPYVYVWKDDQWKFVKAKTDPKSIDKRADQIIDTIMQEGEILDLASHRAAHRPTFGRSRQFNIPNSFLLKDGPNGNGIADFIDTNYALSAKLYSDRMAPAIEMSRAFARPADGVTWQKGFEEALDDVRSAEAKNFKGSNKQFEDHWAPIEVKLRHLADRVTNRVYKDPNRWDNRMAMVLKDWSHLAFMGMSALSAVQEVGTLIMTHGMSRVFRTAFNDVDAATAAAMKAGVIEGEKAGSILDINMGAELAGFSETGLEAGLTSKAEMYLKTAANKYFLLNGLASVTRSLKQLDLSIRVPDMLEKIIHVGDGVATTDEIAYLARFGISEKDAIRMAEQPIESTDGKAFLANTDNWGDEELVRKFRAAVRSGNENTILAATAADKPIISEGTVYLRKNKAVDEMAEKMGWDSSGDYWKVQSGLMALPFTFWNYAMAATNKILLAGMDEPSSQKLAGIASIVGLGYMVAQIKTDPAQWDRLSTDQKIRRAVEQSGIAGVVGNYANLTQGSVIGLTGQNPFPWEPKNGFNPSAADAAFNIAGAGPSVARNAVQGTLTGDANMASWALPMRNHFMLKGLFDAAVDGIERR